MDGGMTREQMIDEAVRSATTKYERQFITRYGKLCPRTLDDVRWNYRVFDMKQRYAHTY